MSVDRKEGRASIWWITGEEISSLIQQLQEEEGLDFEGVNSMEEIPSEFRNFELEYLIKREGEEPAKGDLLKHTIDTYRNALTYIYNGEEFVELYHEEDDYGSIPPEFTTAEFPPDYWVDRIEHNNIIWVEVPEDITWEDIIAVPEGIREIEMDDVKGRYTWETDGVRYYIYSYTDEGMEADLYPVYYEGTHDGDVYTWIWS